jgi:uncharacterized protein (DUF58 family)
MKRLRKLVEAALRGINHDFCPGANPYVYWLKKPIGWVVCGAAFSALVGLLIGPQGFVLMAAFLTLLTLGVVWPWLSMRGLNCRLRLTEPRSREGETLNIELEIRNRWPIPIFGMMLEGQFLQDIENEHDIVAVAMKRVPSWSVSRFQWRLQPVRRGILPADIPRIAIGFPFGLYQSSKPVQIVGRTMVWPQCIDLRGIPQSPGQGFNVEGNFSNRSGEYGEVIGIRRYRHGDSLKNIHWNQTAKSDRLVVRERQSLAQNPFRIIVDLTPSHHRGTGSQSSHEWAIRIAASACQQLHLHHCKVVVNFLGLPAACSDSITNVRGLAALMDELALLPSSGLNSGNTSMCHPVADLRETKSAASPTVSTIVICTDISPVRNWPCDKLFVFHADGFQETKMVRPSIGEVWESEETLFIRSPESVAADFVEAWQETIHA